MDIHAHCADVVRQYDRDRYVATLFAPQLARRHLFAIAAFATEVARVRDLVSEPALGEIRLQWWRDVITAGDGQGHPVATALVEAIRTFDLPIAAFDLVLDARAFDLRNDSMPTLLDLEGYASGIASSLFHVGMVVLAEGHSPEGADAAGHGGVARALTAIMRALPLHSARGQCYLPGDLVAAHALDRESLFAGRTTPELLALLADLRAIAGKRLAEAERAIADLSPSLRPAFLALAQVRAYLDRMDRPDYDPFAPPVALAPWRRLWITWWAARRL